MTIGDPQADRAARQARRTEVRRAQILDAAAEVFGEVGYGPATLEAIGERVGLSKTSLYYYVKSKEELLASIMTNVLDEIAERYAEVAADADPATRLRALARSHAEIVCANPGGRLIAIHGDLRERAASLANTDGRYRRLVTGPLREGVESGLFREVDEDVFSWTFMLALNNVTAIWSPGHRRTPQDIGEEVAGYLLSGLRP